MDEADDAWMSGNKKKQNFVRKATRKKLYKIDCLDEVYQTKPKG